MKRKTTSLLIALLWSVACLPVKAQILKIDGIEYAIHEKTASASVKDGKGASGSVTLPSSVDYNGKSYPVTQIDEYSFFECNGLESIIIPENVDIIENYAFCQSAKLSKVTLPQEMSSIGESAFSQCPLEEVTLPKGLTRIESYCFQLNKIKSIIIPEGVVTILDGAFNHCENLQTVSLPQSLREIGTYAFQSCDLHEVVIPEGVTTISKALDIDNVFDYDGYSFYNNKNLKSVHIPSTVTFIGTGSFGNCNNLTTITVADNNPVYDSRNACNAIIETESNTLVSGCKTTTFPQDIVCIIEDAFINITDLGNIVLPESVTIIEPYAFYNCTGLTGVDIPASATSIGESAFGGLADSEFIPSLTTVTVHATSPTPIDENVFSLHGWDANNNWEEYFDDAPYEQATLYVPAGTKEIYQNTGGWKKFKNIVEMTTGIEDISTQNAEGSEWYSFDGKRQKTPHKGLNIYREKGKPSRKILMN